MTPQLSEIGYPALLTAALAAAMFNRPSWLRSYTTSLRFHMAIVMYASCYLILLLSAYLVCRTAGHWVGWSLPVSAWCAFAAMALIHVASGFDVWIRTWIYRLADIPEESRTRASALVHAELQPSAEVKARAEAMMRAAGIPNNCDWIPMAQRLLDQLRRATWLFLQLRDWDGGLVPTHWDADQASGGTRQRRQHAKRRGEFIVDAEKDLFRLRQRFDLILFRVSRMLASVELLGQVKHAYAQQAPERDDIDAPLRRMIENMVSDSCESVERFHNDACTFATRGVFATKWTRAGRTRAFERLGFPRQETERTDVYLVLALAGGILFVSMWLYFMKQPPSASDLSFFQRIALIVFIQMGAVAIAIHAKLHFGFANGGLHQRTPWGYIAALGAFALVFAILVNVFVGALLDGWPGIVVRMRAAFPWLCVAPTTACVIGWLILDHRWRSVDSPYQRHACDAVVFGLAWAAAGCIAVLLHGVDWEPTFAAALRRVGTFCLLMGATLGALIPERVRYRPGGESDRDVALPDWFESKNALVREHYMSPDTAPPK